MCRCVNYLLIVLSIIYEMSTVYAITIYWRNCVLALTQYFHRLLFTVVSSIAMLVVVASQTATML
jgi:hypothetical protein